LETLRQLLWYITSVEGITEIIRWGGLPILATIVFVETGLFFGFFLPGDSLLVTAGFVASQSPDLLNLRAVLIVLSAAAIIGDTVGYAIGRKAGEALYNRPDSRFFKREHLLKTRAFYERYGPITIVLARFVPFARTFAPAVAGIAQMNYRKFIVYNVCGGIGWVVSLTLLGYFFGQIPFVKKHIEMAILLIIFVSLLPVIVSAWTARRHARAARGENA
jgi:membrane-associated protein